MPHALPAAPNRLRPLAFAAAFGLALSACGNGDDVPPAGETTDAEGPAAVVEAAEARDVRIVLPALDGRPAALYATLVGSDQDDRLTGVAVAGAEVELHETSEAGGVMSMGAVDGIPVPAATTVQLAPGGYHGMIFGTLTPGPVDVTFNFERAGDVRALATAEPANVGSAAMDMPAHEMGGEE